MRFLVFKSVYVSIKSGDYSQLLLLNMKLSFLSISAFRTMAMTVVGADKTERKTTHDDTN